MVVAMKIDPLVRKVVDAGRHAGIAVGVLSEGRATIRGFGRLSARNAAAPEGDTVFEIGSITKAFTGILLAQLATDGIVGLDDPVRMHLPEGFPVPSRNGKEITLLHLATHRSGLPRLPGNLKPKDPENPYADYTVELLEKFLSKHRLGRSPGERYEYSNLGGGLLGNALAHRAGSSYEELVKRRICDPLGMKDTRIALPESMRERLAPGHQPGGRRVPLWDVPALPGAGALRSTVRDMLRLLAAALDGDPAMTLSQEPRAYAGEGLKIGLCWHLVPWDRKGRKWIVWHNGGTGGYSSFAGFVKENRAAVVVLANTSEDVDALGLAILAAATNVP